METWVRRCTWEMILEEGGPKDLNVILGSFVVTIKDVETEKPIFEACFLVHGNKDSEIDKLAQDFSSLVKVQSGYKLLWQQ